MRREFDEMADRFEDALDEVLRLRETDCLAGHVRLEVRRETGKE
jgi:hypothetical protein